MPGERAVIVGASRRGERHLDHLVDLHGDLGARILPVEREVMGHILLIDQLDRHRITGVGLELRVDLPLNLAAHPAVAAHIGFQGILDLSAHRRHRLRRIITARRIVLAPGCGQQKKSRHPNKVPGKTSDRGESIRSFDSHDYLLKKNLFGESNARFLFFLLSICREWFSHIISLTATSNLGWGLARGFDPKSRQPQCDKCARSQNASNYIFSSTKMRRYFCAPLLISALLTRLQAFMAGV